MVVSPRFMFVVGDSPIIWPATCIVKFHLTSNPQLLIDIQWPDAVLHIVKYP